MKKGVLSLLWWIVPAFSLSAPINDLNHLFTDEKTVQDMTKTDPSLPEKMVLVQTLLADIKDKTDQEKLEAINLFYNRLVVFRSDQEVWDVLDYWATPLELLSKRMGDCEDYALSKYWLALKSGIDASKLKLFYARVSYAGKVQPHMVLAYKQDNLQDPLILDNLINSVYPLSKRHDIAVVFSFGVNQDIETPEHRKVNQKIKRWEDYLQKSREQGSAFD